MDELIKAIIEAAIEQQRDMQKTGSTNPNRQSGMDSKKDEAKRIAESNRLLYEAHIQAGFTSEEALALTVTTIQ